jgi:hypothetical protein
MIDLMMLAVSLQRLITAKAVRIIDRAFAGLLFDVLHQITSTNAFNDFGVNMAFSLQKAENKALSRSASSALTFAPASEVSFIKFDLSTKTTGFQFSRVIQTLSQMLIDARDRLLIQLQVSRQSVSWHWLVKAFDDLKLTAKLRKRFLTTAARTFNVTTSGAIDFEGAAENALATPGKVGRTTKMARFDCNHWHLAYASGYSLITFNKSAVS